MLTNDYFFIGDIEYPSSNNILNPYPGTSFICKKVIFNYYLIKPRVEIEQEFGFMTKNLEKFRPTNEYKYFS